MSLKIVLVHDHVVVPQIIGELQNTTRNVNE